MIGNRTCAAWAVGLAVVLMVCAQASAGTGVLESTTIIEVSATSGGYTDSFYMVWPVSSFEDQLTWALENPWTLSDGGVDIASIEDLSVSFQADPAVDLGFQVRNSSLTQPVQFHCWTTTLIFEGAPNAQAVATASMTATQGVGSPSGVSVTGLLGDDDKCYQARYSTNEIVNTKTVFAELVPSQSFTVGGGWGETLPAIGYADLGTTVYMIESEFKFVLSAGDQASGTSYFEIVPEPATLLLLAAGGLVAGRRRRIAL